MDLGPGGAQGNGSTLYPSISADGRFVAFESFATTFVSGDTNGDRDVFVRDLVNGTTERVSVATGGAQANGSSFKSSISGNGRYVAFESDATNLIAGDSNAARDIFVRDRQYGTTERISVATGGAQASGSSFYASISADGRYVAFHSNASNLVSGDANAAVDVFVRDRQTGTTELVSVATGGAQGNGNSLDPTISADGRFVTFHSIASNLVASDTNGAWDVFVRDRQTGTTELISVATGGAQGNNDSYNPTISADGRYVAFHSYASTLVPGDSNASADVFVRDRQSGTTERVSVATGGAQGNSDSTYPTISSDGRYVAFYSGASNLVSGDTNASADVFVVDLQASTTERVSVSSAGVQGNGDSDYPSISSDGRYVAFQSSASNLVSGDTNGFSDVFLRDRAAAGFSSLCDPGVAGVISCPCANPPSSLGRGCDNSSATGGATLSASGIAYLSIDSLVFTTDGERPTATSVVLQGQALLSTGAVYGQGVRCVAGSLKRLFTKTAAAGSITAPDFGAGDPTVSARSAALGDVIHPGQSRWYLVYYRDPNVLGGCPSSSTFNATQTGEVTWSP